MWGRPWSGLQYWEWAHTRALYGLEVVHKPSAITPSHPLRCLPDPHHPQEPISKGERICPQSCLGICLFDAWSNMYQQEDCPSGPEAEGAAPISVQLETANVVDSRGAVVTQKKAVFDHKGQ